MRKFLRHWLGIEDQPSRYELREEIHDILRDYIRSDSFLEAVKRNIQYKTERDVSSLAQRCINDHIDKMITPEKFIDDIVERIRKKQL